MNGVAVMIDESCGANVVVIGYECGDVVGIDDECVDAVK